MRRGGGEPAPRLALTKPPADSRSPPAQDPARGFRKAWLEKTGRKKAWLEKAWVDITAAGGVLRPVGGTRGPEMGHAGVGLGHQAWKPGFPLQITDERGRERR